MKSLTVIFITSRAQPEFDWFLESLNLVVKEAIGKPLDRSGIKVIIVDFFRGRRPALMSAPPDSIHCAPKSCVWQGPDRLTPVDWWAIANARNTALCLCQTEWIAFLDDRMVLQPGWLKAILRAQKEEYVVAGAYQKRIGMTALNGSILNGGTIIGEDGRAQHQKKIGAPNPMPCGGEWLFGANSALPLEWALSVNGVDESCDSSGSEDTTFGLHLQNHGYPIKYDSSMYMIEDRTPELSGPVMIRRDKGVSPNDKSHALLAWLGPLKTAAHHWDIRKVREQALKGFGFPKATQPTKDWYDNQDLRTMS